MKVIGIFGSIGVGKTSFAATLKAKYDYSVITEPVEANPYLENYYKDPVKYATITQMYFLISRYEFMKMIQTTGKKGLVFDRTFYEDHVFADTQHKLGYINDIDYKTYERYYDLMSSVIDKPDIIYYLHTDTQTLLKRVKQRNRDCEKGMTLEYLDTLQEYYDKLYESLKSKKFNIIKVDWSGEADENFKKINIIN